MIFEEEEHHHLEIYDVVPEDAGTIKVTAENTAGSASCTATLDVEEKPKDIPTPPKFIVNIQTTDATVGEQASLRCQAKGVPTPTLVWYKDGREIRPGDNRYTISYDEDGTTTLMVIEVVRDVAGTYTCEATNKAGKDTTTGDLNVHEVPIQEVPEEEVEEMVAPVIVKKPDQLTVNEKDRAEFICKITGTPAPQVTWSKGDEELTDTNKYHIEEYEDVYCFEINQAIKEDTGDYTCTARNPAGEATCTIPLTVKAVPSEELEEVPPKVPEKEEDLSKSPLVLRHAEQTKAPEFSQTLQDVILMEGDQLELQCAVSGVPRPEVAWDRAGKTLVPTKVMSISHEEDMCTLTISEVTVDQAGQYTCTAVNSAGKAICTSEVRVQERPEAPEFVRPLEKRVVKEGKQVKMDCAVKGKPTPEITWLLNDTPIEASKRVVLDKRLTDEETVLTMTINEAVLKDSGTVYVTAVNPAGEVKTSAELIVEAAEIVKKEAPKITRQPENVETFEFNTVTFECSVTGKPEPEVIWLKGNTQLVESDRIHITAEEGKHTLTMDKVTTADGGIINVKVSSPAGQQSATAKLRVTPVKPAKIIEKPKDTTVPEHGTAKFTSKITGTPVPTVTWFLNDQELQPSETVHTDFIKKDNTFTLTIDDCMPDKMGPVKVVAKNNGGDVSAECKLTVEGRAPSFVQKPIKCTVMEGSTAVFRCRIDGEPMPTVQWSKGKWKKFTHGGKVKVYRDEETDEQVLEIESITSKDAGTYTVTLKNDKGVEECSATLIVTDDSEAMEDWRAQLKHISTEEVTGPEVEEIDWQVQLKPTQSPEEQGAEDEGVTVPLRHVSSEEKEEEEEEKEKPEEVEYKPEDITVQLPEREKVELEPMPEKVKPEKAPSEPKEEEKEKYERKPKEVTTQEEEAITLEIPKVTWEFIKELEDVTVKEKGVAQFECAVTVQNAAVQWYIDDNEVARSPKFEVQVDGQTHKLTISNVRPQDSGQVTCKFGDLVSRANLVVEEVPAEFITTLPEESEVTEGQHLTLTCDISKEDAEVTWFRDKEEIKPTEKIEIRKEGTKHALVVHDMSVDDEAQYTVKVGDQESTSAVFVHELPAEFSAPLQDTTVQETGEVTLEVELSKEDASATWVLDGEEVQPDERHTIEADGKIRRLSIIDVVPEDAGSYALKVGDKTTTAQLFVEEIPAEITQPLKDLTAKESAVIKLEAEVSKETAEVKWLKDGVEIQVDERHDVEAEGKIRRLSIRDVRSDDEAEYTLKVGDKESTAKVSVEEIPVEITQPLKDISAKESANITLQAEVSKDTAEVKWLKDGIEIQLDERHDVEAEGKIRRLSIKDVKSDDEAEYTLKVGDKESTAKVSVEEIPIEITQLLKDISTKESADITLQAEVSKETAEVKWLKDGVEIKVDERHDVEAEGKIRRLSIRDVQSDDEAEYTLKVGDKESKAKLSVEEIPVEIIQPLQDITATEKAELTLVTEVSKEKAEGTWLKDGVLIKADKKLDITAEGTVRKLSIHDVQPEDAAVYTFKVDDKTETSASVSVEELPAEFKVPLKDTTAKEKEDLTLEVELTKDDVDATWFIGDAEIKPDDRHDIEVDGKFRRLKIHDAKTDDSARYSLKVGDKASTATLLVEEIPVEFTKPLKDKRIKEKEDVTLETTVSKDDVQVTWLIGGEEIKPDECHDIEVDGKVHRLKIHRVKPEDATDYTVKVGDRQTTAKLSVDVIPLKFTVPLKDKSVKEKEDITLEVELSRDDVDVTWLLDKDEIQPDERHNIEVDGTIRRLTIHDAKPEDSARYTVKAKDKSTSARLKVEEIPVKFTVPLKDQTVKEKSEVTLEVEISRDDLEVSWLMDNKKIEPDERHEIFADGAKHKLVIHDAKPQDSAKYTVKAKDKSTSARLKVEEIPFKFNVPLKDKTAKEKEDVTLEVEMSRDDVEVTWLMDNKKIEPSERHEIVVDGKISRLIIHDAIPQDSAKYTVKTKDKMTNARLKVEEIPLKFTTPLKDKTVSEKEDVTLEAELSRDDVEVTWLIDNKKVVPDERHDIEVDGTVHRLIIHGAKPEDSAKYTVKAKDKATTAKLKVEEIPLTFTVPLKDKTVQEGEDVTLAVELSRDDVEVTWLIDNKQIKPDDRHDISAEGKIRKLVVHGVQPQDSAKYTVKAKDKSTSAKIKVEQLEVEFTQPLKDLTAKENEEVTFECKVSQENLDAAWYFGDVKLKSDEKHDITVEGTIHKMKIKDVSSDDSASYTIKIADKSSSAKLSVEEIEVEFVVPLKDTTTKEQTSVTFECELNKPVDVTWLVDGTEITSNEKYDITVEGKVHRLTIHGPSITDAVEYTVKAGNKTSTARLTVEEIDAEFTVRLKDQHVKESETVTFECTVNKPNVPVAWYMGDIDLTSNEKYEITVDGNVHRLTIHDAQPDDAAIFTAKLPKERCSAKLKVEEIAAEFTVGLQDTKVLEKETVEFTCKLSKPTPVHWEKKGKEIQDGGRYQISAEGVDVNLTITDAQLDDTAQYSCVLPSGDKTTAKLTVKEAPFEIMKPLSDVTSPVRGTVTFECEVNKPDKTARWQKNGRAIKHGGKFAISVDGTTHTLTIQDVSLEEEAEYTVIIEDKKSSAKLFVEEIAVEFTKELEDTTVTEIPGSAEFECELNQPDVPIQWLQGDKPLRPSDKHKMVSEGPVHKLLVKEVDDEDDGDYSVVAKDKKSTAKLSVEVPPQAFLDEKFQDVFTIKAGKSAIFEVPFTGAPQPSVNWTFQQGALEPARMKVETIRNMTCLTVNRAIRQDAGNYELTLENPFGKSTVTIRLNVLDKPSPPRELTVADVTSSSVTLTWEEPEDNGGSDITGYIIEKRDAKRQSWQKVDVVKKRELEVTNLIEGSQLYFRVMAQNDQGVSEPVTLKEPVLIKCPYDKPGKPGTPQCTDITKNSVTLNWSPPQSDGGSPITSYVVEYKGAGVFKWTTANTEPVPDTSYTVTRLSEGKDYQFRISAENKAGIGPPSDATDTINIKEPVVGTPPVLVEGMHDVTAVVPEEALLEADIAPGEPEAEIRWFKDGKQIAPSKKYEMNYVDEVAELVIKETSTGDAGKYRCEASNAIGKVDTEASLTVHVAPHITYDNKYQGPQTLKSGSTLSLKVEVSGTPTPTISWLLDGEPMEKSAAVAIETTDTTSGLRVKNVVADDSGKYRVVAENVVGQATADFEVIIQGKPSPPKNLEVTDYNKDSITVNWQPPENDGGSPIKTYIIERKETRKTSWTNAGKVDGNTLTFTLTRLLEGQEYTVRVSAENAIGVSEPVELTQPVTAKLPYDVPGTPTNLQAMEVDKNLIALQWQAPESDGGSPITSYVIERQMGTRTTWTKVNKENTLETTFKVHDVIEGTEYNFRVSAENKAGVGKPSNTTGKIKAVTPKVAVEFTTPLSEVTVKSGETATLQCEVNKPNMDAKWLKDGRPIKSGGRFKIIVDGTVHSLVIASAEQADEAQYSVKIDDKTSAALLSVEEEKIDFIRTLEDVTVKEIPGTAVFECELTTSTQVQWMHDNKPITPSKKYSISVDGTTVHKLTINEADDEDEGEYSIAIKGKKSTANLHVQAPPLIRVDKSLEETVTLKAGSSKVFEIPFTGHPQPKVSWAFNDGPLPDEKRFKVETIRNMTCLRVTKIQRKETGRYAVTLDNPSGKTDITINVNVLDKPSPPRDLKAAEVSSQEVTLKWTEPEDNGGCDITSYLMEMKEVTMRAWKDAGQTPDLELTVPRLKKDTKYTFQVRAKNECGVSEPVEIKQPVLAKDLFVKPGKPGKPEVSDITKSSVTLTWTEPEDDGGAPISNYVIEYKMKSSVRWTKVPEKVSDTTHTVTGLKEDSEYEFRVSAENKAGVGEPSPVSEPVIVKEPVVGTAPELLSPMSDVTAVMPEKAALSCDISLGEPEAEITWFKDNKEIKSGKKYEISYAEEVAALVILETDLKDSGQYRCEVANKIGKVTTQAKLTVQAKPELKYDKSQLSKSLQEGETLTLRVEFSGEPKPQISWLLDGEPADSVTVKTTDTMSTVTVKKVKAEDAGQYTVVAENPAGKEEVNFEVNISGKPSKPKDLEVTSYNKDSISVAWQPPTDDGGSPITNYIIERRDANRATWTNAGTVDGSTCIFTVGKLVEGNQYYVRVSAKNKIGTGEPVELMEPVTAKLPFDVPDAPTDLTAKDISTKELTLEWKAPEKDGGSPITGYIIECRQARSSRWVKVNKMPVTKTTYKVTDLIENNEYEYRVCAENAAGLSKPSETTGNIVAKVPFVPIKFVTPLTGQSVKEGETVTMECEINKPNQKPQWLKNDTPITPSDRYTMKSDGNKHKLTITDVQPDDAGNFTIKVEDQTSDATLEVEAEDFEFVVPLKDITVKQIPGVAVFECEISRPVDIAWLRGGKIVTPSEKYKIEKDSKRVKHTLTIKDVDGEDEGEYALSARGRQSKATLTVAAQPVILSEESYEEAITLKTGASAVFEIPFSGNPQPTVTWTFNGASLTKPAKEETIRNMTALTLTKVKRSDSGEYMLKLENASGKASITIKVVVLDKPGPIHDLTSPEATSNSISLKWAEPEDDGGSNIIRYIIEKREQTRRTWQPAGSSTETEFTVTNLVENNKYVFKVSAENAQGTGPAVEIAQAVLAKSSFVVPSAPAAPTISDIFKDSAVVSWQPPSKDGGSPVIGYLLERCAAPGVRWIRVVHDAIEETTFKATDLMEGSEYQYRVIAVNKAGESKPSEGSSPFKAKDPWDKPGKPGSPEVEEITSSTVTLSWSPPSNDGGSPILNYIVEYKATEAFRWLKATEETVAETKLVVEKLRDGDSYEFRVSAENKAGTGPPSEVSRAVTVREPISGEAPELVEKITDMAVISPEPATLKCKISPGEPEPEIKWFKEGKELQTDGKYKTEYKNNTATLVINDTEPADAGKYKCVATNALGKVESVGELRVQVPPKLEYDNKLREPLKVKEGGSATLSVDIDGVPEPKITWLHDGKPVEKSHRLTVQTRDGTSTLNLKGLTKEDGGKYSVVVENDVGKDTADFEVIITGKPSAPTNLQVKETNKNYITVTWQPPESDGGSPIKEYIIERRDASRQTWTQAGTVGGSTFEFMITKLLEGNKYYIRVSASNQLGTGPPAELKEPVTAKVPFDVPGPPVNLEVFEVSKSHITLAWDAPENDGGADVKGYVIERRVATSTKWIRINRKLVDDIEYDITDVREGVEYCLRVLAENEAGLSQPSEELGPVLVKEPFDPPDAPAAPEVTDITKRTATLKWSTPEKDGGSPVTGYDIEVKSTVKFRWTSLNLKEPDTVYTVKDLQPGEKYEFRVVAENKAGRSQPSSPSRQIVAEDRTTGEAPRVVEQLKDVAAAVGGTTKLECQIFGSPEPQVKWKKNNRELLPGRKVAMSYVDSVATLTILDTTDSDAGKYICEASNTLALVSTSCAVSVNVPPTINLDRKLRDGQSIKTGGSLKMSANIGGSPVPEVVWLKDGEPVVPDGRVVIENTDSTSSLTIRKAKLDDDGEYTLQLKSPAGEASATIDVEVVDKPQAPADFKVTNVSKDSVSLEWTKPKDDGGKEVTSYIIERRDAKRPSWMKVTSVPASKFSYTIPNLIEGNEYFFRVSAVNDIGTGEPAELDLPVLVKSAFEKPSTPKGPLVLKEPHPGLSYTTVAASRWHCSEICGRKTRLQALQLVRS
ncbi:titin isoform X1 [Lingula anatina]|uniref:Titin n=1 Tax=Lingula anatina TaxID=7574 RepID=A0A2R2MT14_LINAN|nr:titin isoform X1 [Lingula anatina]|eukprot:XP_023933258.1 titin isoform X1 [Lingula anatina]